MSEVYEHSPQSQETSFPKSPDKVAVENSAPVLLGADVERFSANHKLKDSLDLALIRKGVLDVDSESVANQKTYRPSFFHTRNVRIGNKECISIKDALRDPENFIGWGEPFDIPLPEQGVSLSVMIKRATREQQSGQPKNIVEIHGMRQDAFIFNSLDSQLIENCNIISINLPGFGGSDKMPEGRDCIEAYADVLDSFIRNQIGNDNLYAIIGNSLGSVLTAELLKRGIAPQKAILNGLPVAGVAASQKLENPINRGLYTLYIKLMRAIPTRLKIPIARWERKGITEPDFVDKRYMRSVDNADIEMTAKLSQQLAAVNYTNGLKAAERTEILLTGGDRDIYVTEDALRQTAIATPNCEIKIFKDGKHEQFMYDPEHFTSAAMEFLEVEGAA